LSFNKQFWKTVKQIDVIKRALGELYKVFGTSSIKFILK